ncbi:M56 family metallopeptidase [Mariniflexile sp. AS56]|uniref:M56 family metallopeptidase n=1 Tax=Mariniflexile sp. AS56 TaxID=3063957 RepID=UPI0026F2E55E|nr:M56 family metallopeptidase [Mariniflexile sp. AS56]MDO7174043.1 M56 family metallopeptidase [Mariniflexile sp. AS56]
MDYLLKSSALVVIFYFSYKLLLQRETFFEQNRWFLLAGLGTAFILPLIVIPVYIEAKPMDLSMYQFDTVATNTPTIKSFNILEYLPIIYGLGIAIFTVRFLIQFASLVSIIIRNKSEKTGIYKFIKTTDDVSPFSFFNWIVCNPTQFSNIELEQIITHEQTHASQKHSLDILVTQLSCIVLWFNPFIWLYNKDLKQNLEFIADKVTATKTNCKKSYQYTLLKTSLPSHQMALSNPFYNSLIKKRIVMLQKSKSKKINQLKYALVIPVLALFLMSFNTTNVYIQHTTNQNSNLVKVIIDKNTTTKELLKHQEAFKTNLDIDFIIHQIETNPSNELTSIRIELINRFGKLTTQQLDKTKPISPFVITYDADKNTMETHRLQQALNEIIITKNYSKKDLKKLEEDLKKEGITLNFKNIKHNNKNEITSINIKMNSKHSNAHYTINGDTPIAPIKIIINNGAISIGNATVAQAHHIVVVSDNDDENEELVDTDPQKKVSIYKFGNNTNTIAKKETIMESQNRDTKEEVTKSKSKVKLVISETKEPLIMVDEKEITQEDMNTIDPNTIEKVDVLKGDKATNQYGDKGKNGVILITTKTEGKTKHTIKLNEEALYKIDGKEVKKAEVDKLNPDDIASINILKDDSAIKKYGEKAKNGVIEIITKKKD